MTFMVAADHWRSLWMVLYVLPAVVAALIVGAVIRQARHNRSATAHAAVV
ncbi:MAG: hypothetical protein J0H43_14940 [Actinobacteria bacterium]|nr:hypothetical protein [Actinomycetota bacterium]